MNGWIFDKEDSWYNLNDFCHIWIQTDVNKKFFCMGEWKHNSEEVVISPSYDTFELCKYHMQNKLRELEF